MGACVFIQGLSPHWDSSKGRNSLGVGRQQPEQGCTVLEGDKSREEKGREVFTLHIDTEGAIHILFGGISFSGTMPQGHRKAG